MSRVFVGAALHRQGRNIFKAPIQMYGSERTSVFLHLSGPYCHPKGLLLVDGSHGDRGTSVIFLERQRTLGGQRVRMEARWVGDESSVEITVECSAL